VAFPIHTSARASTPAANSCNASTYRRESSNSTLVVADVNAGGRHAGVSTEKGRSQWIASRRRSPRWNEREFHPAPEWTASARQPQQFAPERVRSVTGEHGNCDKSRVSGGGFAVRREASPSARLLPAGVCHSNPLNVPSRQAPGGSTPARPSTAARGKWISCRIVSINALAPASLQCARLDDGAFVELGW